MLISVPQNGRVTANRDARGYEALERVKGVSKDMSDQLRKQCSNVVSKSKKICLEER